MDLREKTVTEMIQRDDRSKWLSQSNHNIKCFTESEIGRITSNYGAIIGKGAFGEVYRGVLEDGSTVAVKRFVRNIEENFAKELKVHSEINHKNVVRLIGYCAEDNALMIVTEYISKGNLADVLHQDSIPIVLDIRLRIAVECSEALSYMHSQMYTHVVHGDIKPANILLDENFNAKISDFGISRLVNTDVTLFTDNVIGSIGYMDPLFARDGRITSKSDVYSFGIVLLELITRKKASLREGEAGMIECFTKALAKGIGKVRKLFDGEISSQNNMKVLEGVAKLAGECLRMEMDGRPEMKAVAARLQALRKTQGRGKQTQNGPPAPGHETPAATGSETDRDAMLNKIATEKRLSLINCWEKSQKIEVENRAVRKISSILSSENTKKADVEAKLQTREEKLGKKAEYTEKMMNQIATIHKQADKERASVEVSRQREMIKVEEKAAKYRLAGSGR